MTSRFFAFGCSFTQYSWPTWADILGREFDYWENWAQPGAGNHFILYSLIEAIARHKINRSDSIGIMWTSTHREDRFLKGEWKTPGSIYCNNYPSEYLDQWVDSTHYLLTTATIIASARRILDHIGCRYWFFSMVPINDTRDPASEKFFSFLPDIERKVLDLYAPSLDRVMPSVYEIIFNLDWNSRNHVQQPRQQKAMIEMFRNDYERQQQSSWPTFEDFIAGDLDAISFETRNQLDHEHDFFTRRHTVLNTRPDFHPIPSEHQEYLEHMGFDLTDRQRDFVQYWDNRVTTDSKYLFMSAPVERF